MSNNFIGSPGVSIHGGGSAHAGDHYTITSTASGSGSLFVPPLRNVNAHIQFADFTTYGEAFLLPALASINCDAIRFDISWDVMQTTPGGALNPTYMTRFGQYLNAFQTAGIKVLITAGYSPPWASSGQGQERNAFPIDPSDYADFVGAFLTEYGSLVEAWEVWNEPDQGYSVDTTSVGALGTALVTSGATTSLHLTAAIGAIPNGASVVVASGANSQTFVTDAPTAVSSSVISVTSQVATFAFPTSSTVTYTIPIAVNAANYVALLEAAYPAIKAAAPNVQVCGPVQAYSAFNGSYPGSITFDYLQNFFAANPQDFYDIITLHLYTDPPSLNDGLTLTGQESIAYWAGHFMPTIERYDLTSPIWITEVGWDTVTSGGVSNALQAQRLTETYDAAMSQIPRLARGPYWYQIIDDNTGGYGLYTSTTASPTPLAAKPSSAAMAVLTLGGMPADAVTVDSSSHGRNGIPVGDGISLGTGQSGFGSCYTFTTGGQVDLPDIPMAGAFTIDCWCQNASASAPVAVGSIVSRRTSSEMIYVIERTTSPVNSFGIGVRDGSGTTHFLAASANDGANTTWHHLEFVWDGTSTIYFFLDGTLKQSAAMTTLTAMDPEQLPTLGADPNAATPYAGNIDEVRFSNVARNTATFTKPSAPYTSDSQTLALYHLNAIT